SSLQTSFQPCGGGPEASSTGTGPSPAPTPTSTVAKHQPLGCIIMSSCGAAHSIVIAVRPPVIGIAVTTILILGFPQQAGQAPEHSHESCKPCYEPKRFPHGFSIGNRSDFSFRKMINDVRANRRM